MFVLRVKETDYNGLVTELYLYPDDVGFQNS